MLEIRPRNPAACRLASSVPSWQQSHKTEILEACMRNQAQGLSLSVLEYYCTTLLELMIGKQAPELLLS
jgi:hypothetical protein